MFWETSVEPKYTLSCARHRAGCITESECEACWTRKLWPLHIASPVNHHIDIRFGRRHGDGSSVSGAIKSQICIFDVIFLWNAICVPIFLRVSFFLISVTKLWDMIICLCMCKGRTHHTKGPETKTHCEMANTCNYCLPITVKSESKCYISDEIDTQNLSEWCHTSYRKSG